MLHVLSLDAASCKHRGQIQPHSWTAAARPGQPLRTELLAGGGGSWSSLALTSGCLRLRLKPALQFVSWNQEGWKTSLCSVPPVGHAHSLLALANNTCVKPTFMELRERFMRLYRKKVIPHRRWLRRIALLEIRAKAGRPICYLVAIQEEFACAISNLNEKFYVL